MPSTRTAARILMLAALVLFGSSCRLALRALRLSSRSSDDPATYLEGDDDGECTDKKDNDGNGKIDCQEPFCRYEPACDPAVIEAKARTERATKVQAKVGGTYAVSCDREQQTTITLKEGSCTFALDACSGPEALHCTLRESTGMLTVDLRREGMPASEPLHTLRMRIADPSTLVVDGNQMEACRCGPTPRLVFKRTTP
ncbi:MAG: hypothetical protein KC656_17165 [Myxococcales bacterium]|nr:hypothetical protein [Myxococcales bacterium]